MWSLQYYVTATEDCRGRDVVPIDDDEKKSRPMRSFAVVVVAAKQLSFSLAASTLFDGGRNLEKESVCPTYDVDIEGEEWCALVGLPAWH